MRKIKVLLSVFILFIMSTALYAERELNGEDAKKLEVRHSMIGYRNTLLFYTFEKERAILVITIDNKDESFPLTGRIHLFAESTSEKDLGKWINNQHSDGLYPDIPTPTLTQELPKDTGKITSSKKTGTSGSPGLQGGNFKDFEVDFEIQEYQVEGKFKLSNFKGKAKVHVKS